MTRRRLACAVFVILAAVIIASGASGVLNAAGPAPVFRVFLKNGTALACWGEYARVGDRLVLTVPIGTGPHPAYEFVSLPVARVDMDKTERYAEAVRAAQFASSRGKAEYAELSDRLAKQLASISSLPDPKVRLATADQARQDLIDWAETSHGYHATEVQQMLQLFDAAIVDLRVAAGESRFAINLSAAQMPLPPVTLSAAPTSRETIDLAVKAAMAADSDDIRRALLKRVRSAVAALPATDARNAKFKAAIGSEMAAALRLDGSYRRLDADIRRLASTAVERGDVLAFDALRRRVTRTDRLLGRQRPEVIAPLLTLLDQQKDLAAQQRLVLDHWASERGQVFAYRKKTSAIVAQLDGLAPTLRAIRDLTGPPLTSLVRVQRQTSTMAATFDTIAAPDAASAAHLLLGLAIEQAQAAVEKRHRAVDSRDLALAREAALAARDATTRLAQAKNSLAEALKPPKAIR